MHDHVGVGQGPILAGEQGVVGEGVAVEADQTAAGPVLGLELLGAHEAHGEIHPASLEAERRDHPVAIVVDVVAEPRRKAEVRPAAIEASLEPLGNLALDLQVAQLPFDPHRCIEAGEGRGVGEAARHEFLSLRQASAPTSRPLYAAAARLS